MRIVNSTPNVLKKNLDSAIQEVVSDFKENYHITPNTDFLIRVKQDRTAMREIGKLPMTELDTDVSFTITTTQTKEDKENGYKWLHSITDTQKGRPNIQQ